MKLLICFTLILSTAVSFSCEETVQSARNTSPDTQVIRSEDGTCTNSNGEIVACPASIQ